jgi:cytochrome c biogenesis protein CcmG/thiol:disulfide interchange protein DsbE
MNRRVLLMVPLGVAVAGGAAFYVMLNRMKDGTFDPRGVPSMLIDKPVPKFSLPGQNGVGFSDADLAVGKPVLINFFASWCVPCVEEAPSLMTLHEEGVPIYGIAYKDIATDTAAFLDKQGNPFTRVARDVPGRVAIDWGVSGVPETYLVDGNGIVRWRFVGPIPRRIASEAIPALMKKFGS